jgi:hypothetical protein
MRSLGPQHSDSGAHESCAGSDAENVQRRRPFGAFVCSQTSSGASRNNRRQRPCHSASLMTPFFPGINTSLVQLFAPRGARPHKKQNSRGTPERTSALSRFLNQVIGRPSGRSTTHPRAMGQTSNEVPEKGQLALAALVTAPSRTFRPRLQYLAATATWSPAKPPVPWLLAPADDYLATYTILSFSA